MTAKIVVVGSFNTDLVVYTPHLPRPGETVNGKRFATGPGGKGSNQAVAAARLGAEVTFIGRVGRDAFAEVGLQLWNREGIHTEWVGRDDHYPTGIASIAVDDQGENTIIVALGANLHLSPAEVDAASQTIAEADVVITQLEVNLDAVRRTLEVARQYDTRTILNPAPAAQLPPDLLSLADYITPNVEELRTLIGNREMSADDLAHALLASDRQTVIVTLGAQGAAWYRRSETGHRPAFPVSVVDTVGAGDAFNAGLAVALAEGLDLPAAVTFANATAAVSVTRPGAAASMPYRHEVDSLLAS